MGIRLGIGGLKIGQRSGTAAVPFDWSSYWATRFPSALQAVPYSGTRIDLAWTNNGVQDYDSVSIEGSTDGINYTEYDTVATGETTANITGLTQVTDYWFRVRYIKGSSESAYTDVVQSLTYATAIFDGHTLLWIPYEDSSLYSLSGSNILEVTDKLGSGRKFVGDTVKPTLTANGIYFPDLAKMVATFSFNAVNTIYIVMAAHEFRTGGFIMQLVSGTGFLFDTADNKFSYRNGSGGALQNSDGPDLNNYGVFMMGCNSVESTGFIKIDDRAADTGVVGSTTITGINFYSNGVPGSYSNWTIKEFIVRDTYDYGTENITSIYNYLVKKK